METLNKKELLTYLQKQQDYWQEFINLHPDNKNNDVYEGLSGGYHNAWEAILAGNFDTNKQEKKIRFECSFYIKNWTFGFCYMGGVLNICLGPLDLSWWKEKKIADIEWFE